LEYSYSALVHSLRTEVAHLQALIEDKYEPEIQSLKGRLRESEAERRKLMFKLLDQEVSCRDQLVGKMCRPSDQPESE
jgi:hypothetical protein